MKKYIIFNFIILIFLCTTITITILNKKVPKSETFKVEPIIINYSEYGKQIAHEIQLYNKEKYIEDELSNMRKELDIIDSIGTNMEWFIAYKEIINKYSEILDPPENVYDCFSEEEIYLIQRAVETECYDQNFNSKCMVASVIFNRFEHPELNFGDSITDVITAPNQFSYWRKDITESTKLAVEYAYEIVDLTNGCIGFHSNTKTNTFNGWVYSFTDEIGHHFYKERTE